MLIINVSKLLFRFHPIFYKRKFIIYNIYICVCVWIYIMNGLLTRFNEWIVDEVLSEL